MRRNAKKRLPPYCLVCITGFVPPAITGCAVRTRKGRGCFLAVTVNPMHEPVRWLGKRSVNVYAT